MKNAIKFARILACLVAVSVAGRLFAQEPIQASRVSTYDLQILSLPLTHAQAPNASIVGAGGNSTYYYWVVAKFVQGNATPSPAGAVYFAPDILSGSRYVSVSWPTVTGAIGYDLLRSSSPNLPASGAIAVSLDQGGTSFNDQGGALSNYTVNTYTPPIWLDATSGAIRLNGSLGTSGQCVTSTGTASVWGNCGGGGGPGTVTSVGLSLPSIFSVTGSPVTTSGTLTGALVGESANTVFSGPNGSSGIPAFRSLVAADIPAPAGDVTNTYAATTVTSLHFGSTGLALPASLTSGDCLGYNGTTLVFIACSGGGSGLPSSWSLNGTTNSVDAQPAPGQDATTIVFHPSLATGGTADIVDFCGDTVANTADCTNKKYVWITWNGNLGLDASNFQLSTTTGAAPYFYLNGTNSLPGQPFLKEATASLAAPILGALSSGSGSLSGAQYVKITYVNAAGETVSSNEQTITLAASSSLIVPAPGAEYSAYGYQIYVGSSSGAEALRVPTSSNCTLASETFGGNAVCSLTSNTTFQTLPAAGVFPPSVNTTGGAQIVSLAPYGEAPGVFLTSSTPGAEATLNSGLILPGGEGVNLTSGATTTAQTLACFSASETASQCGANATNVTGVFTGARQNAAVQINGIATINLAASATTTYGHYACTNATAGTIVDSLSPCATGQQIGIIAQTNGSAVSSVPVFLQPGASNTLEFAPDAPPASPGAMSDEFNTGNFINLSKWAWMNQNGGTDAISDGYLVTTLQPFNGYLVQGFTQATQATPYAFEIKCSQPIVASSATVTAVGLGLYETSSTKGTYFWFENPLESVNAPSVDAQAWTANTFGSAVTPLTRSFASYEYLMLLNDGTNILYSASVDGRSWTQLGGATIASLFTTSPDKTGIFFLNNGAPGFATSYGVDFFRDLPASITTLSGSDNFPNSSDLNNYTSQPSALPNGWSITSNTLTNSNASGLFAILYPTSVSTFTNGSVSIKVQLANTTSGQFAGVGARVNTSTGARYIAVLNAGTSQIALFTCTAWASGCTSIGSSAWTPDTSQHTLTLSTIGSSIKVYLDGTQKISSTDGTWTEGGVSIENYQGNASYQSFSYSSVTSSVTVQ